MVVDVIEAAASTYRWRRRGADRRCQCPCYNGGDIEVVGGFGKLQITFNGDAKSQDNLMHAKTKNKKQE